jgi:hypothetical protein
LILRHSAQDFSKCLITLLVTRDEGSRSIVLDVRSGCFYLHVMAFHILSLNESIDLITIETQVRLDTGPPERHSRLPDDLPGQYAQSD